MNDYFQKPGLSFHQIKDFAKSPRFYLEKHVMRVISDRDKAAYAFGRAVHCRVLEGEETFAKRFVIAPPEHTTASGGLSTSKATRDWQATLRGKEIIGGADADLVQTIAVRVNANPFAAELLRTGLPEVELASTWEGVEVKGRVDWLCADRRLCPDLKTTRCLEDFPGQCWDFGYDQQVAWYLRLTGATDAPLLVVETEQPHRVAVYRFSAANLAAADQRNRQLLARFSACRETDTWPADPAEIITLSRPTAA